MSDKTPVTVASVKTDHPDVAQALIKEGAEQGKQEADAALQPKIDAAVADAVKKDRERIAALDGLLTGAMASHPKAREVVNAAKADGSSVSDAKVKLFDAGVTQQAAVIEGMQNDDASASGAAPAAPGGATAAPAQTPDGWKAEWEKSEALKAEFPTAELYVAFKKAESAGKVRIFDPGRKSA